MLDILQTLRTCWDEEKTAAVATIISVDGSTYRREGTRCVILDDGRIVGIVSGGCVEADLAEHARSVLSTGVAKLVSYDFRDDNDLVWGLGMGCNGALTLLISRFDRKSAPEDAQRQLNALERRVHTREAYTVGLVVESEDELRVAPGTVLDVDPALLPDGAGALLVDDVVDGTSVRLFVEHVTPRHRLVVYGAGPDALPVVKLAHFLEWRVTVVDHRPSFAEASRFPDADEVVRVSRTGHADVPVDSHTAAVIMTHNYEIDRSLVAHLLPSPVFYVGALGPRKRTDKILSELGDQGVVFPDADLRKLFAPVGLDLGAETPEEIATAVVSEALAAANQRGAGFLRSRQGPLHSHSGAQFAVAPGGVNPGACET